MTKHDPCIAHESRLGTFVARLATITTLLLVVAIGAGAANDPDKTNHTKMSRQEMAGRSRPPAAPTFINLSGGSPAAAPQMLAAPEAVSTYDPNRLLAAHLLRRAGFGPTFKDLKKVAKNGAASRLNWINSQLNPSSIDDSNLTTRLPHIDPDNYDFDYLRTWFVRMAFSNRQLQEKMTLIWHEHFSVSLEKVAEPLFMSQHEALLRKYSLGNFKDFLVAMTQDNAMLRWLDNDYNYAGNPTNDPPNENYAREFMQLYTLGTVLMAIDGTPIHADGTPVDLNNPSDGVVQPYSENVTVGMTTYNDVQMLARSLAGWHIDYCDKYPKCSPIGIQDNGLHNTAAKTLYLAGLSINVPSNVASDAKTELQFVVDQFLNGNPIRRDSIAAFIAKILIGKLATENPSPAYIQAVAMAFRDSGWEIKEAVRAVLTNPEFESPANVRTMYKEPIEQYVGGMRALFGESDGAGFIDWANDTGQLIWWPPSVFSFYPPGHKGNLVNTMYVFERDDSAGEFVSEETDTIMNLKVVAKKSKLLKTLPLPHTEAQLAAPTVDYLADLLIGDQLDPNVRQAVINYITTNSITPGSGQDYVNDGYYNEDIRYAVWVIMVSPDFQRN
jgi:uncharacterized protein (DUF1800 family)